MAIEQSDFQIIEGIVIGAIDRKVQPIHDELKEINRNMDNVNVKLGNHIEHFAYQFTEVKTDVGWLKDFITNKIIGQKSDTTTKPEDQKQNVDWLTWAVRLIIGTLIVNVIGLIFMAFELFKK